MRSAALVLGATRGDDGDRAGVLLRRPRARRGARRRGAPARPVRRYGVARARRGGRRAVVARGLRRCSRRTAAQRAARARAARRRACAAVALAILPATLCLGATLPALGQALVAPGDRRASRRARSTRSTRSAARSASRAAGFGLPALDRRARELRRWSRGDERAAPGVARARCDRRRRARRASTPATRRAVAPPLARRSRSSPRGAGALGLGLEVLWTRLFAQVLHNSVYSFAAVALVFLLAIAAGAALAALLRSAACAGRGRRRRARRRRRWRRSPGVWIFVRLDRRPRATSACRPASASTSLRIVGLAARHGRAGGARLRRRAAGALGGRRRARRARRGRSATSRRRTRRARSPARSPPASSSCRSLGLRGGVPRSRPSRYVVLADVVAGRAPALRPLGVRGAARRSSLADPLRAPLVHLRAGRDAARQRARAPAGIVTRRRHRRRSPAPARQLLRARRQRRRRPTSAAWGSCRCCCIPHPRRVAFIGLATGITRERRRRRSASRRRPSSSSFRRSRRRRARTSRRGTAICSSAPTCASCSTTAAATSPRPPRALRRHRLRSLHPLARGRGQPLRARDVRDRARAGSRPAGSSASGCRSTS